MRTRQEIEQLEAQTLAPYAMKSGESAGRVYPEPVQDLRTCYQRDRDRIVHCTAFRNLEYKTQVFVIFEGDYYRTRLTHTIEVAQIARSIGRNLQLNEDLIEAIALAHDLGHPPFGHAGETALDEIMSTVTTGFNHNVRSFEIVTRLEKRYPQFDGLNLSEEVLIGILKHTTAYDKPGVTDRYANKGTTIEAQVVDMADSIAYLSHDLDDGLTSGCIVEDDLLESALWQRACAASDITDGEMKKYQIVKALINMQISDLLAVSDAVLQQHAFSSSTAVREHLRQHPESMLIGVSPTMKEERDFLQQLLNEKLYHHYRVAKMTDHARRIIKSLFEIYRTNPNQLPYDVYPRHTQFSEREKYERICNYIASMTDRVALNEYKKIYDPYQKV